MRRKMVAFLLILVLVITGFQGCSTKKEKEAENQSDEKQVNGQQTDKKSTQMGRYMEKEVKLPEFKENETVIKIIQNSDSRIELYTRVKGKYQCYRMKSDMTWESGEAGWLNNGKLSNNTELNCIYCGEDGNYYAGYTTYDSDARSHIIKSEDKGKTSQEIKIPYLNKVKKSTDKCDLYPVIQKIEVLENGNLVLDDYMAGDSLLIFSPKGEELDKLPVAGQNDSNQHSFQTARNDIIAVAQDYKGIILYDTVRKKEKSIEYNANQHSMAFDENEDGTVFMGNSEGIHRLNKDGTLWETVVDGALNSMNMPSLTFDKLFAVKKDEGEQFYSSYQSTDGSYRLVQYIFDKNVSSIPSHEITVYSLQENSTVRQAISLFQAMNTDIKVDYVVAMGEEGGTVSDYIRSLNTELLAGNGADVLVLDGLSVDSYQEKGVLADISDIIKPLEDSGELLSNLSGYYNVEGKVYQMPVRFRFPIIIGKEEAISSLKDMDHITNYVKQLNGKAFSSSISYRALLQNYLALYSKDLYENGKLNKEKLETFLRDVKVIADNIKATEKDQYDDPSSNTGIMDKNGLFMDRSFGIMKDKYSTSMYQIRNIICAMNPITLAQKCNLKYTSINQMFVPDGLIGLNSASKEADIAKKFITFLYSKEVQNTDVFDGFPMNKNSLSSWMAKEDTDSWFGGSDAEGNELATTWPTKEERKELFKVIQGLKTPIEMNQVINVIIDEAIPYLTGDTSSGQAAAAAYSKISIYLAE